MSTAVSEEIKKEKLEDPVVEPKPFVLHFAEELISPRFPRGMSPSPIIPTQDGSGGWTNDD